MSPYGDFLHDASRSGDAVAASVADNCRFDERAGAARWQRFEGTVSDVLGGRAPTWDDWAEACRLHLEQCCTVSHPSVPDAFLEVNRPAWLEGISENQTLIRIEELSRALDATGLNLKRLAELLQQADGDGDAHHAVRMFFEAWNQRRDARPAFAAFADEVQTELDDDDWPHTLRDRLGLGHYGHSDGPTQPIALMRYSVADVQAAGAKSELGASCALPTVLDGGLHEFFFPVPQEHPFGATVHLVPDRADTLTAEVLHCRIDYKREHLWRLGEITQSRRLNDGQLREARDLHLYALREACNRGDFGEPLEDRA